MSRKKNRVTAKTAPPRKGLEFQYFRQLKQITRELQKEVSEMVLMLLKTRKREFQSDGIGLDVNQVLASLKQKWGSQGGFVNSAKGIGLAMVNRVNASNRGAFVRNLQGAVGVDINAILREEELRDFVESQVSKNVSIIENLPVNYLNQIEILVNNGVSQGLRFEEIAKQITAKTGSANAKLLNRIKTIARNEVANINSQLNKRRSETLGIKKFIWQTAMDERVRGNPGGLYPNARPSHYHLNGKEFTWRKGAKTSAGSVWPGSQINCRCVAINVISE